MSTLEITQVELKHLITHHVGNKGREEKFSLSEEESALGKDTKELLLKYFLQPLKAEEFFAFAHPVKLALNEVYTMARRHILGSGNIYQRLAKPCQAAL